MASRRRDDLEQAIEETLAPRAFIGYRENGSFVQDIEAVRARIAPLIKKGKAARAVTLLETFIAGCYEKSEEIDDSDGSFGQFVEELFCDWIRARQGAGADPAETAGMLLSWMESDEYGYCHGLEKEAVRVLDRAGLEAFERAVREKAGGDGKDYANRRKVEILKAIYEARRDVDAYAALCEAKGNLAPAPKLMLKEGRADEWAALVGEIRESHRRKSGFMSGFERLGEGRTASEPSSFLDRARKRWDRAAGRGRGTS